GKIPLNYVANLGDLAGPLPPPPPTGAGEGQTVLRQRAEQVAFAALPSATPSPGPARMDTLMANLVPTLPHDAMVTLGA
ncbi:hypothetical protein SB724_21655, partial [Bacillus sp. SIMBA_031]|uniref:hypothetical protein n=1 Tax=Bacillus sp. SIMBA_031 TaxID=3085774 RepID=UPI003978548B